jgi:hypothetical protein
MTIQKKSLISTLNTTKKAIVAGKTEPASTSSARSSARTPVRKLGRESARKPNRSVMRRVPRKAVD